MKRKSNRISEKSGKRPTDTNKKTQEDKTS
jgi:hypothetical protein